jgi:ABC-type multidrug transport system fused ATPase/permease subunit
MFVMTDTVRQNLDIAGANISDDDIVGVLELVGLWKVMVSRRADVDRCTDGNRGESLSAASDGSTQKDPRQSEQSGSGGIIEPSKASVRIPAAAILDRTMKSEPLSQGQEQLFSLARALLVKPFRGRVVLLDEATSSVDGEIDKLIQATLREQFKDHTVITVAHRLDTVMDSDVVLVLRTGKLVEAGPLSTLAAREGGVFRALLSENK